jgi:YfiH family protein
MPESPLRWTETLGPAVLAGTGRSGGVSTGPYASLNLGGHVGDEPEAVLHNRGLVAGAAGAGHLVIAEQVHGRRVVEVEGPWAGDAPEADALFTRRPGLVLAVLVADCTPVVVAAPDDGMVGVAHAGRRGMSLGVATALVEALRSAGAGRLVARVGPSICARCYEVPLAMREQVAGDEPVTRSVTRTGTPSLDVAAGVLAQLVRAGVEVAEVPGCTAESDDLFSYRRSRTTGRFAGLAWVQG